ncbi:RAD55 family ATPase [Halobacterium litoreum]|uniref:RAD55 family ATPase n=1 Tax=Halobacterium litoreum TaxID=2039234 RepID=A0ABD5NIC6_9EURY|nr:recombinase RecA [Halobacterium litoreum]UHH12210.1 recombinase RecA [Halobacterium litoreum]
MQGYAVADRLPVDEIPAGSNVLVAGPPLTGKRELALGLVDDGCERGDGGIVVGTRDSTERIKARAPNVWRAVEDGRGGIVDCVSRQRGDDVRDRDLVKYVGSPGDVTDIGIRLGGLFQSLEDACDRARVNVSTISTMLMYADTRRVYRFLHVFSGHVERLDWLGFGVLDTSNKEAFDVLAPLYDGMVQTRATDDGTEVRVVGLGQGRTDWVAY